MCGISMELLEPCNDVFLVETEEMLLLLLLLWLPFELEAARCRSSGLGGLKAAL